VAYFLEAIARYASPSDELKIKIRNFASFLTQNMNFNLNQFGDDVSFDTKQKLRSAYGFN